MQLTAYNEASSITRTQTPCTLRSCKVCPRVISDFIGPHNCHFKSATVDCNRAVYAIRCEWCNVIYVGQTKRKLRIRIHKHIRNIKNKLGNSTVSTHMNQHSNPEFISIHVLEYELDDFKRLIKEQVWITLLNCTQPLGINIAAEGHYSISLTCLQTYRHFQYSATCRSHFKHKIR